jgi:hypothetical protein
MRGQLLLLPTSREDTFVLHVGMVQRLGDLSACQMRDLWCFDIKHDFYEYHQQRNDIDDRKKQPKVHQEL